MAFQYLPPIRRGKSFLMQEGENPSTLTGINIFYRVFSLLFEKWNNKKEP